jgi:hypothetical protein
MSVCKPIEAFLDPTLFLLCNTPGNVIFLQAAGITTAAGNTALFQRTDSIVSFPRITKFQFTLVQSLYPAPTLSLVQLFATLNVSFAGNSVLNAKGRPTLLGQDGNHLQVVIARPGAKAGTSAVSTSSSLSVEKGSTVVPTGDALAPAPTPAAAAASPASRLEPGWVMLAVCVLMSVLSF